MFISWKNHPERALWELDWKKSELKVVQIIEVRNDDGWNSGYYLELRRGG